MGTCQHRIQWVVLLTILLPTPAVLAETGFEIFDINEGELNFLDTPPKYPPHHHSTQIHISKDSLKNGWVGNRQCHYQLTPVPAMEIVFRRGRVRNIDITRKENIRRAWVDNNTVQMEGIQKNAVVCISSETLSLETLPGNKSWVWRGGPYMKRFLDGYFPMKVSLAIDYPADEMKLERLLPPGLRLKALSVPGHLRLTVLFEGRLNIEARFQTRRQ